jgi:hypothetical protein
MILHWGSEAELLVLAGLNSTLRSNSTASRFLYISSDPRLHSYRTMWLQSVKLQWILHVQIAFTRRLDCAVCNCVYFPYFTKQTSDYRQCPTNWFCIVIYNNFMDQRLFGKLIVARLIYKLTVFYRPIRFISVFTIARHFSGLKRRSTSKWLHGATSQKTLNFVCQNVSPFWTHTHARADKIHGYKVCLHFLRKQVR